VNNDLLLLNDDSAIKTCCKSRQIITALPKALSSAYTSATPFFIALKQLLERFGLNIAPVGDLGIASRMRLAGSRSFIADRWLERSIGVAQRQDFSAG